MFKFLVLVSACAGVLGFLFGRWVDSDAARRSGYRQCLGEFDEAVRRRPVAKTDADTAIHAR